MSYIHWRIENEDKYVRMIEDGETENIPAFVESSKNIASDMIIGPVVDQMLNNDDMTLVHFAGVFAQYLYETYHISPADVEIFSQYVMLAAIHRLSDMAYSVGTSLVADLFTKFKNDEEEDDDEDYPDD